MEQAVEKDVNHINEAGFQRMESKMEKVLEIQQKMSAYLNMRLDFNYKELNEKSETLDAYVVRHPCFSDCRSKKLWLKGKLRKVRGTRLMPF